MIKLPVTPFWGKSILFAGFWGKSILFAGCVSSKLAWVLQENTGPLKENGHLPISETRLQLYQCNPIFADMRNTASAAFDNIIVSSAQL